MMLKMKTKIRIAAVLCFTIVFSAMVCAQPQIPLQIYGSINESVPDGSIITFKIGEVIVGSGIISDRKYGYDPLILIQKDDPLTAEKEGYASGNSVDVFIEDVKTNTLSSLKGENYGLNLTITKSAYAQVLKNHAAAVSGGCLNNYSCDDWSECIDGNQERFCKDTSCAFNNKTETQYCLEAPGATDDFIIDEPSMDAHSYLFPIIISIIIVAVIIGGGFTIFKFRSGAKSRTNKTDGQISRLKDYISNAREKGYTDDYVRNLLKNNGWSDDQLDNAFK